ncbi:MAG TPA: hypothetical protein IGS52_00670 [Oscillatoriaceae cyanobacterium M33_DOE_052]|uniref:Uncharacterized protein n=1 Tax=Planktothricoides sp. SpSt-374 TaxID=2282167 RepID=A0A7C3VWN3_9CYAN|nr:hypothetical protein [Oscillatoriaceae cyanobacterium M33_DOE_052]
MSPKKRPRIPGRGEAFASISFSFHRACRPYGVPVSPSPRPPVFWAQAQLQTSSPRPPVPTAAK